MSFKKTIITAGALAALAVPGTAMADHQPTGQDRLNAARECRLERGTTAATREAFAARYGTNANRSNAFGKCVSQRARDEQREREQAARAAFSKDLAAVSERLDAIVAEAQAELVAVAASDPTKHFVTTELERITLRTPIVTEDLRHLPEPAQVARLRAALASGERAERYAALRAGRALLAEREASKERQPLELRAGRPVVAPPDYSELAAVVRELEAGLIDSARQERAEERIAAAQRVSSVLGARRYMAAAYGPDRRRATAGTW